MEWIKWMKISKQKRKTIREMTPGETTDYVDSLCAKVQSLIGKPRPKMALLTKTVPPLRKPHRKP